MSNIQNGLQYFFRVAEDPNYVQNKYLVMACLLAWAVIFLVAYRSNMERMNTKAVRAIGFVLFSLQLSVTLYFLFTRENSIHDSLPLYFCRISSLVVGVALMRNKINGKVTNFFALFSIFGASIALMVPDMEHYNFPHFTSVSYIMIHSLLLLGSMYIVKTSKVILSNREVMKIAAVVLVPIHMLNLVLGTNYAYTVLLPSILRVVPRELSIGVVAVSTVLVVIGIQKFKLKKKKQLAGDGFVNEMENSLNGEKEYAKVKIKRRK